MREILATAVNPAGRLRLGDALATLGKDLGLTNEDLEALDASMNRSAAQPMSFE